MCYFGKTKCTVAFHSVLCCAVGQDILSQLSEEEHTLTFYLLQFIYASAVIFINIIIIIFNATFCTHSQNIAYVMTKGCIGRPCRSSMKKHVYGEIYTSGVTLGDVRAQILEVIGGSFF